MQRIANLVNNLNDYFSEKAHRYALESQFIRRKRKITGAEFIKAMILGNMADADSSIEGFCGFLRENSINITKQGLNFRFTASAVAFMEKMFQEAFMLFKNKMTLNCNILKQFNSVKLLDSTYLNLPNSMQDNFKGYGSHYKGKKNTTQSGIKLQLMFDYLNTTIENIEIKEGVSSDQGYRGHLNQLSKNDLLISDLGYFVPEVFKIIEKRLAFFISRYKADTNIYCPITEQKLELLTLLQDKSCFSAEVLLGKESKLKVRLVAYRLSESQAEYRKRKANKLAKSRGYKSSDRNQQLLNWSIFITNIPTEQIAATDISVIYKIRWQIELLYIKSHQNRTIKGKK
jgi:hypothetical protein